VTIAYPPELPVSARRDQIAQAIRTSQVVIVSGETGSGKTTQIPKILLELGYGLAAGPGQGRGRPAMIGHTQPRRIAARSVAERLSQELGTPLGGLVGNQVRFTDHSGPDTRLKVMTDGVLLNQIQRDPELRGYAALIIDEAHERSLNIDFLLGYLSNLLPRRPDLKVVITSATIDSELFAAHFGPAPGRPAPVIEVTGRTYPVEIRYRPPDPDLAEDQPGAIVKAARELLREGPGDILVFCSGEREIRDATDALVGDLGAVPVGGHQDKAGASGRANLEILPLYSRLSAAEQHRVFEHHARRRIVLATNVAETSLTVPGIHYVIDPGTARISRYSKATKVQRLPIEPISQASANQRAGRCGRVAAGVCLRLYSKADFDTRPEFTEPEILRTSLASVILQMVAVGVAKSPDDVAKFPFVQPPDARNVLDGVRLLEELGALETEGRGRTRLTGIGRQLARLPIDPRLARMIVEAQRLGVTREVTIIAAALSIQDPRERPAELRAQADQAHARFNDATSEFLSFLNLWEYLKAARADASSSKFRRLVRSEYLNYLRLREWQDLVKELRRALKTADRGGQSADRGDKSAPAPKRPRATTPAATTPADAAPADAAPSTSDNPAHQWKLSWDGEPIHRALLTGLLSQIGLQQVTPVKASARQAAAKAGQPARKPNRNDYLGARGIRFAIFPGSPLHARPPAWIMAAELVETSRLWARTVAKIDPAWVEAAAPAHLIRRTYAEPRWSAKRGAAIVNEKVLVYGLPVVAARAVPLARIDAQMARDLFIRHALVQGEWSTHHEFFRRNRELLDRIEELAARSRQAPLGPSDQDLFGFYDDRLPATVVSARHFDSWWKKAKAKTPDLLDLDAKVLRGEVAERGRGFPDVWSQGDFELPLTYEYAPGQPHDGATCHIPIQIANQLRPNGFDWHVPGLRADLVAALIKALPKKDRTFLLPAAETARQAVERLGSPQDWPDREGFPLPLTEALTKVFQQMRDVYVPPETWTWDGVPEYLRLTFVVEDPQGRPMASGHDLLQVVHRAAPGVKSAIAHVAAVTVRPKLPPPRGVASRAEPEAPAAPPWPGERPGLQTWDFGDLPAEIAAAGPDGLTVRGFPALVPAGDPARWAAAGTAPAVGLRLTMTPAQRDAAMPLGLRWLLLGELALSATRLTTRLRPEQALALAASHYPNTDALCLDAQAAAIDALIAAAGGPVWTEAAYLALRDRARDELEDATFGVLQRAAELIPQVRAIEEQARQAARLEVLNSVSDIGRHLGELFGPGWLSRAGVARYADLKRYLAAERYRLERLGQAKAREEQAMYTLGQVTMAYGDAIAGLPPGAPPPPALAEVPWMIEELRVSLFAQQLGTKYPVSEKRIRKTLSAA
jgi:ATP-dependent helicase HrpA